MKKPKIVEIDDDEPTGVAIGYARVSTADQNLDMQLQAMRDYGIEERFIFREKVSGASAKRPQLTRLWRELRPGDALVVWKIDRLGRNVRDLLNRIHELGERGVRFVSLRDNIDTDTPAGRLLLVISAAMAQFERELTVERTKAGIAAKKARGESHGAKPKFSRDELRKLLKGGMSGAEAAKRFKVTKSAIYQAIPAEEREKYFRGYRRKKPGK